MLDASTSILDVFREDQFRLGDCQVIPYDRRKIDVFGTGYLSHLYAEMLKSNPRSPYGILPNVFCGVVDLSMDAICAYLHTKPIALLCIWDSSSQFTPVGFCWPTQIVSTPVANSAFCGFTMFKQIWGTPECTVLGMLGIAYLFVTHKLRTINGQRYSSNRLAARWMKMYGERVCGTIPDLLRTHKGTLESCEISSLSRADFEQFVRRQLLTLAGETITNGQGESDIQPERGQSPGPTG